MELARAIERKDGLGLSYRAGDAAAAPTASDDWSDFLRDCPVTGLEARREV
jgi:hypothetical protein